MHDDFHKLANKYISTLVPYQPGKPIEEVERELGISNSIKLASNENPLGPSPKAIEAATSALSHAHIYPDGGYFDLKQTVARHLSVKPDQLTFGNGSENVIEFIIKAYLSIGDSAVISEYAFLTIPILIKGYGATLKVAPAKNWGHDIDAMLKAIDDHTRILFLVNPNNPTGTYTNKSDFEKLLQHTPSHILIVIDEAYAEYIDSPDYPHAINYLDKYPNLIITRTFSKVYGLAALRLGFAISSTTIADILHRARLPFNVNTIAAKAGCAAILDLDHVKNSVALNKAGMQQMLEGLNYLNLNYIPSLCNFVTIDVDNAMDVYQKLLHKGMIVRPLKSYNMPRHIRVSIGTHEQNDHFLQTLKNTLTVRA